MDRSILLWFILYKVVRFTQFVRWRWKCCDSMGPLWWYHHDCPIAYWDSPLFYVDWSFLLFIFIFIFLLVIYFITHVGLDECDPSSTTWWMHSSSIVRTIGQYCISRRETIDSSLYSSVHSVHPGTQTHGRKYCSIVDLVVQNGMLNRTTFLWLCFDWFIHSFITFFLTSVGWLID